MIFLWGFLAGYWTCCLLGRALNWWYRRRDTLPPTRHAPPPMPTIKPAREPDFWDVAQQEPTQPLYMYGIGIEDFE